VFLTDLAGDGQNRRRNHVLFLSHAKISMLDVPFKGGAPEALGDCLKFEIARWSKVVKEAGIKVE
jgi:hypothetical protein